MSDDAQKVKIVKGSDERVISTALSIATILFLAYVVKSDIFDKPRAAWSAAWGAVCYRVSIWQAEAEIRSLPVTDVTRNNRS